MFELVTFRLIHIASKCAWAVGEALPRAAGGGALLKCVRE